MSAEEPSDSLDFDLEIERLAPALFAWAEARLGAELCAALDPQDLVQEVWCRAWRKREDFAARGVPFRYWVFRIAKNVLLEALRRLSDPGANAGTPGSTTRLFLLDNLPDHATTVSRRLARDELREQFASWLSTLDEADRALVLHVGLEGMTHAEAATRLGLNTEALSKRWQRLTQRLPTQQIPKRLFGST